MANNEDERDAGAGKSEGNQGEPLDAVRRTGEPPVDPDVARREGRGDGNGDGDGDGNGEGAVGAGAVIPLDGRGQPTAEPDRLASPVDVEQPPRLPFVVVGVGASAGGVEAFTEFLQATPADTGMAYVLVVHLPPDRDSLMAEVMGKRTPMPVVQIEDGMEVHPDHVYVIRPGRTLTLHEGRLRLSEPLEKRGHTRPVDDFFRSLAEEQRERAVCVILSGMGSNGTVGAQAVKAVGGVCVAQEPESALFPSMPRHLIDSGNADYVLRPRMMSEMLVRFAAHPYAREREDPTSVLRREQQEFTDILAILRTRTRQDFSGYKRPTLFRRIQRRMGLNQLTQLGEYVRLLRNNAAEVQALADDVLIHVTGFFRDPSAWESLRERVIVPLVSGREPEQSVRCWVTACSSGEEAYSLAILLSETMEELGKNLDVKIFATDMAERSLGQARAGTFPLGIESEVSPERLERYFERDDAMYRVKKSLREMVVFAPQNVLTDPPFSRLDVCTCRNLLIYLEPEMQQRVLRLVHFGLRDGGALLLGTSETVGGVDELFEAVDKKWRIYRRVGPTRHGQVDFPIPRGLGLASAMAQADRAADAVRSQRQSVPQLTERALLSRYTPAAVAIDREYRVVYFHGRTERFLMQPAGEPTRELLLLSRDTVRGAVRAALTQAVDGGGVGHARDGTIETDEGRRRVWVSVAPLDGKAGAASHYYLVSFEEREEAETAALPPGLGAGADDVLRLSEELARVRDELQSTIEELQSSNEELKASNEEVTSNNEELQSSNEELETSKEELQSLNEELTTVNAQLQAKNDELQATGNDLSSLLASADIAVIFLDTRMRIRRFTPAVKELLELISSDVGRPLSDLARKFEDDALIEDAQAVLAKLVPIEAQVRATAAGPAGVGERWYLRRVTPYRTSDDRIDGVVITFVDITARKTAEAGRHASDERMRRLIDSIQDFAIFTMDEGGRVTSWNNGAEQILGWAQGEMLGEKGDTIFTPEDRARGEPGREMSTARRDGRAMDQRWHLKKDGTRFWANGVLTAMGGTNGGFVKIMRDETDRKAADEERTRLKEVAEAANASKDDFLAMASHELRTPVSAVMIWVHAMRRALGEGQPDREDLKEALEAIEHSVTAQKRLVDDLIDSTQIAQGKLRVTRRRTDLAKLVRGAVEAARGAAAEKGVTLDADVAEIGEAMVDPERIEQVVANLLGNAIKFTPAKGSVRLTMRRAAGGAEIVVTDTGRGMSAEFLPRLFQRFSQEEGGPAKGKGGLGLGLAIARQLVELHGGTVTGQSAGVGKGSTFTVRLPVG